MDVDCFMILRHRAKRPRGDAFSFVVGEGDGNEVIYSRLRFVVGEGDGNEVIYLRLRFVVGEACAVGARFLRPRGGEADGRTVIC